MTVPEDGSRHQHHDSVALIVDIQTIESAQDYIKSGKLPILSPLGRVGRENWRLQVKSWCEGPKEIIQAAHRINGEGRPGGSRIALILVDNAVEVMAKTFLALPKRISGVNISRKDLDAIFESFPSVMSCLEKNSGDRLNHIDIGEIEWHHGLRNKLYHDGSGLTVEKSKVDVYLALALEFFKALFDDEIRLEPNDQEGQLISMFLSRWVQLEKGLIMYSEFVGETYGRTPNLRAGLNLLAEEGKIPAEVMDKLDSLQRLRNAVVHGQVEPTVGISARTISTLGEIDQWLRTACAEYRGFGRE